MGIFESRYFIDNTCLAQRRDICSQGPSDEELLAPKRPPGYVPDQVQQDSKSLLELCSIENCPSLDLTSESDPYVEAVVKKSDGTQGTTRVFPYILNATNGVWNLKRVLDAPLRVVDGACAQDELSLKVYDQDAACTTAIFGVDVIGNARIPVSMVEAKNPGDLITVQVELSKEAQKAQEKNTVCTLSVRMWPKSIWDSWPKVKWIFLIRHGESLWNVAEREKNVVHLLETVDHSLSADGHLQGLGLSAKVKEKVDNSNHHECEHEHDAPTDVYSRFMAADAVFASPFTRAVQTALVTLQHHPMVAEKGIILRPELQEIKNIAGRDTIGSHKGESIRLHVHAQLDAMYTGDGDLAQSADSAKALDRMKSIPIDATNASHEWWNSVKESESMTQSRMREILVQTKYSAHEQVVLVAHSLLFRKLCKSFLSAEFRGQHPEFAERLGKFKMPNAGVMGLRVDFNKDIQACVDDVYLMFGTRVGDHGCEEHSDIE